MAGKIHNDDKTIRSDGERKVGKASGRPALLSSTSVCNDDAVHAENKFGEGFSARNLHRLT